MTLDVYRGCKTIQQQQLQKEQVFNFFVKKTHTHTHTHIFLLTKNQSFLEFLKNFILILKCRFDEEILLWKTDF